MSGVCAAQPSLQSVAVDEWPWRWFALLLLAVLSVLLRGIFALKNDVMLFCGAWRIPEPELEVVVPPPPPPPPLQPAHLQQGHTFEDIDAMFDNANSHGPALDTDEDGPVSPEELAYLTQDAERVETEHDMLFRIRCALRPFTQCAVPEEVYIRRNEILAQLVHYKGWVSSQDKFEVLALATKNKNMKKQQNNKNKPNKNEVLALIFQYWSHGSHPPRGALRLWSSYVDEQPDAGRIAATRAIFEQLSHRVPNVSESDGEEYDANLCHSCEQRPMCERTEPECEACYSEH